MEATIQMIFLLGYAYYDQMHRLPEHIREAAHCIMVCRTAVLGGHTQACPDGHYNRHWYNSCKHRMCPLCAFTQIERWLARQKARILNTDHFHDNEAGKGDHKHIGEDEIPYIFTTPKALLEDFWNDVDNWRVLTCVP